MKYMLVVVAAASFAQGCQDHKKKQSPESVPAPEVVEETNETAAETKSTKPDTKPPTPSESPKPVETIVEPVELTAEEVANNYINDHFADETKDIKAQLLDHLNYLMSSYPGQKPEVFKTSIDDRQYEIRFALLSDKEKSTLSAIEANPELAQYAKIDRLKMAIFWVWAQDLYQIAAENMQWYLTKYFGPSQQQN